jgi:hypothetical protein
MPLPARSRSVLTPTWLRCLCQVAPVEAAFATSAESVCIMDDSTSSTQSQSMKLAHARV